MHDKPLNIICRPARPNDTPDVLELTKTIWEGRDYIPYVWERWLADAEGKLIVAEHDGQVVGISKLSRLSQEDWWMEGLRVHPEFEGRGIASRLTDVTVQAWLEIGCGTVRLGTASFRLPVHHMCARLGFEKVNEQAPFYAPAIESKDNAPAFQAVAIQQIEEAANFARRSPSQTASGGLMDLGWRYAPPRAKYLAAAVERGLAWWWGGGEGLLTARIDEDDELGNAPTIELLACPLETIPQILLDLRRLAASLGYSQAAWMAPLLASLLNELEAAGYRRTWEDALYIFAKNHPVRPGKEA